MRHLVPSRFSRAAAPGRPKQGPNARGRGQRSARVATGLVLAGLSGLTAAAPPAPLTPSTTQLPTGGSVSAGQATIRPGMAGSPGSAVLNVDQSSQRAAINWDTFNLGSAAQLNFNQPNSSASTLNRVLDSNPSQILGKITAPGQVVLSNPNGVIFGKSASVDVGGLTATTHGIGDAEFMAGDATSTYRRNGASGKVVNEGELRAALGGYIALLAPEVRNDGVIVARLGTVALAAGEVITLHFSGSHALAGITVQPSAIKALVDNQGAVLAPGGLIILSARALDRLQGGVVKNSGLLEATGLSVKGGRIVLEASERIDNSGRIAANAATGTGTPADAAAGPAGSVTLSAPEIVNSGSITATGAVAQAPTRLVTPSAGGSITLNAGTITQKPGALLDVSGSSGGSLKLRATLDLALEGSLSAVGESGAGGNIVLVAGRDATLANTTVDASGHTRGGHIHVEAGRADVADDAATSTSDAPALPSPPDAPDHHPTAALLGNTQLRSASRRGNGGSITLTGEHVELLDRSVIDATGATGGGDVLVGGGWQGSGSLRQATQVTQAAGSVIDASATEQGDGGTIVLWSDIHRAESRTRVHGSLVANAASAGGAGTDGGRIETSGHWLDVEGVQVQATAGKPATGPAGKSGQWLLDPYDVAITTSANSNTSGFASTGSPSNIQASTITTALNAGTSVTVTTGTSGTTERGDINVNTNIDKSAGSTDVTLTLRAANSIVVNSAISHTGGSGKLNLVLDADNNSGAHDGAGVVILNANLATGGGSLQFGVGNTMLINGVTTQVGGDVYVGGSSAQTITTGGGVVTVNGEMLLANPSGLTLITSGGNVTFGGLLNAGNSYTNFTSPSIAWTTAYAAAKGASAGGSAVGDTYLATITSRLENAVASRAASYSSAWLGARRGVTTSAATTTATSDNYWRWVTGPEASQEGGNGLRFWLGATSPGSSHNGGYANWNGGEPNNSPASGGTNESAIQFIGNFGRWNDLDPALAGGGLNVGTYLRELNLAASPLTVSAGSGTVTFTAMVGGLKALASLNVTAATVAINGGGITTEGLQTYQGAVTLGSAATTLTQTAANTDFTLGANRSISNATGANASLTIKTTGGIVMAGGSSITSATGSLTPVLNADSDASGGGYIWLQQAAGSGASISSNGGAITLSGGADVAAGYAEGRAGIIGNGVTLDAATLHSGGGNIVVRGKSATTGSVYISSDSGSSNTTDGVRLHGSNLIDAGAGSIDIRGVARGSDASSSNGIETGTSGYSRILSSAAGTTAIKLYGDASAGSAANGWGTFLWGGTGSGTVLAATGAAGGITLNGIGRNTATGGGTQLEPNTYVLAASGPISLTGTQGSVSTYEDLVVNGTLGFAASLASGWGIASPVTASGSAINIAADSLSANRVIGTGSFAASAVQSSGTLTFTPRTAGRALALQTADPGAGVAWIKPASMFGASGLFKTGFNKLVFGSSTTGSVTLDNYAFDNDTDLDTGGAAVLGDVGIATKTLTVNVAGSGSITDTGTLAVSQLALQGSTSAATLDSAGNSIGTVAANVASLALVNASALTVGSVGGTNGVTATGTVDIATLAGDLSVAQNIVTTNAGTSALRLNAGRSATAGTSSGGNLVLSGNPALTVGSGGRGTLFSGSVAGSSGVTAKLGSASGRFRYDSDETNTNYGSALGTGLYAVYREQPVVTVTANAASRSYDGVAYSGGNGAASSGYVNGDTSAVLSGTLVYGGNSQGATAAGSYTLTPGGYANGLGYGIGYASSTLTVDPRVVTFSGTRSYDAGTTIAGSALAVSNAVAGDSVVASGSGTLSGKGAGLRTISTLGSIALGGAAAGNYTLAGASGSVTITAANLSVTGVTAADRTYDATTGATLVGSAAVAGLGSDAVSVSGTGVASFANKNAGVGKAVSVSGYSLTGADASSYSIVQPTGLVATIAAAAATVTGVSASGRSYDGTTVIGLTGSASVSHFGSDVLSVAGSGVASIADKHAGSGKPVTVSGYTLAGADAGNYSIVQPAGLSVSITPAAITLGTSNVSKVYDGSTRAAGSASVAGGTLFGGDTLSGGSYAFTSKNVGSGDRIVTVSSVTLNDGNGGADYSVNYTSNTTSTIVPAALTVTAPASSKTYDATTRADGSAGVGSLAGSAAGETIVVAATLAYTDKNAGSGKTVRASGLGIRDSGGTDVTANYAISYVDNSAGSIAPAALTVTANADSRFVARADTAGFNGASYSGLVGGETAAVLGGTLAIVRPNAASDVAAGTYAGALVPSGLSSGNYRIDYAAGTYTILPANRLLVRVANTSVPYGSNPGFSVASAEYLDADNTTIRALTGTSSGTSSGNRYTFTDGAGGSVAFTLGALGTVTATSGKTAVGNYAVGDDSPSIIGNNFTTLNFVGNLAVTQKPVAASASGVGKVYDGSTAMSGFTLALSGKVAGDVVTASGSGAFTQKQAGAGIGYAVTGMTLGGADGGNYYLTGGDSFTGSDGTITALPIAVSGVAALGKTYDATRNATLTGTPTITRLGSDDVSVVGSGTATFADKNTGTGKAVSVGGFALAGADAANYAIVMPTGLSADIAPATLTVSGIAAANKVYDGTTAATLAGTATFTALGTDALTLGGTASASFGDKNAAGAKAVTVSGFSLSGADAANYTLVQPAGLGASIAPRTLNLAYGGVDKVYDGSTAAAVTSRDDRVAGDTLSISQTASFADKNAATGKAVTVSGIGVSGADAANYVVSGTGTTVTSASIAPRPVGVTFSGVDKVYDGTSRAPLSNGNINFTNLVAGDSLSVSAASATYDDKNAGSGKPVAIGGLTLGGADANNYALKSGNSTGTGTVATAPLVVNASAAGKVYDSTTGASAVLSDNRAVGDALTLAYASAAFADKNAGSGKLVTVSGISLGGADAGNYSVGTTIATATADIAKAVLTLSATGLAKVYDASTNAAVSLADNRFEGDALSVDYATASFADKHAGSGKAVSVGGIRLSGTDAANYDVVASTRTTGSIAPAPLTVNATAAARPFDGHTQASVTLVDNRVAGDELTLVRGDAAFADAGVGSGKTVTVGGIRISGGADQGNYVLVSHSVTATSAIERPVERADTASLRPITPAPGLPVLDLTRPVGSTAVATSATAAAVTGLTLPAAAAPPIAVAPGVASLPVKLPAEAVAVAVAVSETLTARPITSPATPVAPGSAPPVVPVVAKLADTDPAGNITVSLVRPATAQQAGIVSVSVPKSISHAGNGFTFPLPTHVVEAVVEAAGDRDVRVTLLNGDRLPTWLRYVPGSFSFVVDAAPAGALPVQVLLRSGKQRWSVVITERTGA